MVLCIYMKPIRNDVHNLSDNTHVLSNIYWEFYHTIAYIVNEGRHSRIHFKVLFNS